MGEVGTDSEVVSKRQQRPVQRPCGEALIPLVGKDSSKLHSIKEVHKYCIKTGLLPTTSREVLAAVEGPSSGRSGTEAGRVGRDCDEKVVPIPYPKLNEGGGRG